MLEFIVIYSSATKDVDARLAWLVVGALRQFADEHNGNCAGQAQNLCMIGKCENRSLLEQVGVAKQYGNAAVQPGARGSKQAGCRGEAHHARSKDAIPAVPRQIGISDVTVTEQLLFS